MTWPLRLVTIGVALLCLVWQEPVRIMPKDPGLYVVNR